MYGPLLPTPPLNSINAACELETGYTEIHADPCSFQTPKHTPAHSANVSSSTPAWDPDSSTPIPGESTPTPVTPLLTTTHELLDRRLLGLAFKVNVHGGGIPGTAMTITVLERDDKTLGFRGTRQGKEGWFDPSWVQPRRPVPNRGDNGPMVVTCGNLCGTHVRRIASHYNGSLCIMRCALVDYNVDQPDKESEEEIFLGADEAVLRSETAVEKSRNKPVISRLWLRAKNPG